jgi:putative tryptophan/tyrosine transport system substrate-binding protein
MNKKISILVVIVILIAMAIGAYFFVKPIKKERVYRVGILSGLSYFSDVPNGFKEGMISHGYIEGKNISYDLYETDFDMTAYKTIIKKFISDKVDLILVFPTEAAQEAKALTLGMKIPIVFVGANVEEAGLIKSVREPGENITGVRWTGSDVALSRFETMHELVPQAKRFLVPYQRKVPIVSSQLVAIRSAAEKYGITIVEIPADSPSDLEETLKTVKVDEKDAMLFILEPLAASVDGFTVLDKFATEHKIPLGGTYAPSTNYQVLFGMNPDNIEMGKLAAVLADKILRGASAGSLMVSSVEPRLILNYKLIQKMGLTVSESLLNKASEIIR